ncbi:hypothetical protein KFU94_26380 [Chloroflexi bacterium TSY]|nr:hypothetical protein [Chloroflexi bacterium TSY]
MKRLRTAWLTAQRAGLQRILYRVRRRLRLRIINPLFAEQLYPLSQQLYSLDQPTHAPKDQDCRAAQRSLLAQLVDLRHEEQALRLLNQPPWSLQAPINWHAPAPISEPLWTFQLHGWEWAWPHLTFGQADLGWKKSFQDLWRSWSAQMTIGRGAAWEPYPTSRRLICWAAAWYLLDGGPDWAVQIDRQTAYLVDHLERDLDNNHLIANGKALAWVGLLLPRLPHARQYQQLGLDCLWDALRMQVRADGGHVENSTSYHMSVWLD